jgi:hypothetical protein
VYDRRENKFVPKPISRKPSVKKKKVWDMSYLDTYDEANDRKAGRHPAHNDAPRNLQRYRKKGR